MRLTKANSKAINYACKNFHYSKTVPSISHAYNVYNDKNEWCGVIIYGVGANPTISKQYSLKNGEVIELERVALNGKQEQTSKAVALSLKMLHKDNPIIKLVVSYADNRQNHLGIIYQATNWLFLGKSKISGIEYYYNNKWIHSRSLQHFSKEKIKRIQENCVFRKSSDKFKYIYCFDKELRQKYLKETKPYPNKNDLTVKED